MADDPHTPPCKIVVEPGDLFGLALDLSPDLRREVLMEATAMGLIQIWRKPPQAKLDSDKDPSV